jgi:hypothetical protein
MRYEKVGRTNEQFVELMLDDRRVYFARGKRKKGATSWTSKDSDHRVYPKQDAGAARAFYEAEAAKLVADKFESKGVDTPVAFAMKNTDVADLAQMRADAIEQMLKRSEGSELEKAIAQAKTTIADWNRALAALTELGGDAADTAKSFKRTYGSSITHLQTALAKRGG